MVNSSPSIGKDTLVSPSFEGGPRWGGPAVDPKTGVLYVNANNTAWLIGLTVPPPPEARVNAFIKASAPFAMV